MGFEPPPSVVAALAEMSQEQRDAVAAGIPWCNAHAVPHDEDGEGFYCPDCRTEGEPDPPPQAEALFGVSEDPQSGDQHVLYRLPDFDGRTYSRPRDHARLGKQALAVWGILKDGGWHTLAELSAATGYPEASISARIRDLRKPKFGGYDVERENTGSGLWRYRLVA